MVELDDVPRHLGDGTRHSSTDDQPPAPGAGRSTLAVKRPRALLLAAAPLLLLAVTASAEAPAPSAVTWDDRHMLSNFANRGAAVARPAILGLDPDGRIAREAVSITQVQEQLLTINPHGWQPGSGRRASTGTGRPFARGLRFTPPTSAMPQRSSAIRTHASHVPRGGTRQ